MATLAAALALTACTRPIPLEEAEARFTEASCRYWAQCECEGWFGGSVFGPCEDEAGDAWQQILDRAEEFDLTYDPKCMGRLVAAYERRECLPEEHAKALDCADVCPVMYGTLSEGEPCIEDEVIYTRTWGFTLGDCGRGLLCLEGQCQDPCDALDQEEGERCGFEAHCLPGLYCENLDVCRPLPGVGEPCLNGSRCDDRVAFCDRMASTCEALREIGESCTDQADCTSLHCPDGTCAAAPGLGEECILGCADGLYCHRDECVVAPAQICL